MKVGKLIGNTRILLTAIALAGAALANPAQAAVWTFSSCSESGVHATCVAPGGPIARGISNTGGGGTIAQAGLVLYGDGLGVRAAGESSSSPHQAADNSGWIDAVLLKFDDPVDLDAITIGWPASGYDTDVSVLRYTGTGNPSGGGPNGDLFGKTYGQLTSSNWDFAGHYADLDDNVARGVNAGNFTSRFWLISAHTSLVGSGCNTPNAGSSCDSGNDYFKLLSVTSSAAGENCGGTTGIACPLSIPEPGTAGLLMAAFAGGALLRRRRRQAG
jgi:hypothetical protein